MIPLLSPSNDDDGGGPALDLTPIQRIMHTVSISLFFVSFKRVSDMYVLAAVERGAPVRVGVPSPSIRLTVTLLWHHSSHYIIARGPRAPPRAGGSPPATKIVEKPCPFIRPSSSVIFMAARSSVEQSRQCGDREGEGGGREGGSRSIGTLFLLRFERRWFSSSLTSLVLFLVGGFAWLVGAPRRS